MTAKGGVSKLVLPLVFAACGPRLDARQASLAVERLRGIQCPPERIAILEERKVGADFVYAVDACGVRIDLEEGLDLPKTDADVERFSADEISVLRRTLQGYVPHEIVTALRYDLTLRCDRTRFSSNATFSDHFEGLEDQAACRLRVAKSVVPLGTEQDLESGTERYWFRFGEDVFSTYVTIREAPSSPTPSKVRAEAQPIVANRLPDPYLHDGAYFRLDLLGVGYMNVGVAQGFAIGRALYVGGTPAKGLVVGGGLQFDVVDDTGDVGGVVGSYVSFDTVLLGVGPFVHYYPDPRDGWRLEAAFGLAARRRLVRSTYWETGPHFALGGGYDSWVTPYGSYGVGLRGIFASAGSTRYRSLCGGGVLTVGLTIH